MIEHPEITWIERTGYPSWMQPKRHNLDDEDDWDEEEYEEDDYD